MGGKSSPAKKTGIFTAYLLLVCTLPIFALIFMSESLLEGILSGFVVLSVNLVLVWTYQQGVAGKIIAGTLKAIETAFSLLVIRTQGPIDLWYVLSNPDGASAISMLGSIRAEIIILAILAASIIATQIWAIGRIRSKIAWPVLLLIPLAALLISTSGARYIYITTITPAVQSSELSATTIPIDEHIAFESEDTVIILHLESWNSKVANGDVLINGQEYTTPMAPHYLEYAKRGIYFPEFYGNSMLTSRSQENTLCGISDNLGEKYSFRTGNLTIKCLPRIFADNGYTTYFFKAHDLSFDNTGPWMQKIGFNHTLNQEIMRPEDIEGEWGYQDDIYYQRIFEHLSRQPPGKKFIYIAQSGTNHWPFIVPGNLQHTNAFANPQNFYEKYANAMRAQDYQLQEFFKHYEEYDPEHTHLFIMGDHSFPVGINRNTYTHRNAYDDNFLTTLLYIPPRREAITPAVVKARHDQIGLFHTVIELMADHVSEYSIREITPNPRNGRPRSIRLNQPYGDGTIGIVRYPDKWIYNTKTGVVVQVNLEEDRFEQHPQIISTSANMQEFLAFVQSRNTGEFNTQEEVPHNMAYPVYVGDGGPDPLQAIVNRTPTSEDFKTYFTVNRIQEKFILSLNITGVDAPHRILINGEDTGVRLCVTGNKTLACDLGIESRYLQQGRNTLLIVNNACAVEKDSICGWSDDYVIYSIVMH